MLTLLGSCIFVEFTLDAFSLFVKPAYTRMNYPKHTNTAWHDHLQGIWCIPGIQRYKALPKNKEAKESTCYKCSIDKVLGFQPFLKIYLMRIDECSAVLTTQKLENNQEVIDFQKVKIKLFLNSASFVQSWKKLGCKKRCINFNIKELSKITSSHLWGNASLLCSVQNLVR